MQMTVRHDGAELQQKLLAIQFSMAEQMQKAGPPPAPQENWPSAIRGIADSLGGVLKTLAIAYSDDRKPRSGRPVLEVRPKPIGSLGANFPRRTLNLPRGRQRLRRPRWKAMTQALV